MNKNIKSFSELIEEGKDLKEPKKLFGCYILENSIVLFPSERGTGKTFFMLQLAMAIAGNQKSFCGEEIELNGNVVFVNLELSESMIMRRLKKLNSSNNFENSDYQAYAFTANGNLKKHLPKIQEQIANIKPVLVIIDNLRAASSDINNEKNVEVTKFMNGLKKLKDEFNCAIVLVHHTRKGSNNRRLNSDMQSGAGAWTDLADGDFFLGKSIKGKDLRLLRRLKSRDCEAQEYPKLIKINPKTTWFELVENEVDEDEHIDWDHENSRDNLMSAALELKKEGKSFAEIGRLLNKNRSTISRWLNALHQTNTTDATDETEAFEEE